MCKTNIRKNYKIIVFQFILLLSHTKVSVANVRTSFKKSNDEKAGKFEIDACTFHAPKVISYAYIWTSFLEYIL